MSKVVFENLTKKYKSSLVLNNFNLEIESGELIALLGPSGCGKTTTLQLLAGFISPDGGRIIVNDEVISSDKQALPPEKRSMSLIFQSYAIWPHLSVFDNVAFGLKLKKIGKKEIKERVFRALSLVHLEKLSDRYPSELSGGQQQRVALARAVVVEPSILLLDEPLSNLDVNLREVMRNEILTLHRELKLTSFYVTHDRQEAMALADRVVVMNKGKIQQVDSPYGVYEYPQTAFVAEFIGRHNLIEGKLVSQNEVLIADTIFKIAPLKENIAVGSNVTVCIHPHALSFDDSIEKTQVNKIKAEVVNSQYFGEYREHKLKIGENRFLTAITSPRVLTQINRDVSVFVPISKCLVLPYYVDSKS